MGLSKECLHDLTGAPTKTLWVTYHQEEIWNYILKSDKENFAMTAGTAVFESG